MMRVANLLILLIAVLMTSCFKDDESESLGETSKFLPGDGIVTYSGYVPLADRPVRIHFHIPANGDMKKMPVLFVFPVLLKPVPNYYGCAIRRWRKCRSVLRKIQSQPIPCRLAFRFIFRQTPFIYPQMDILMPFRRMVSVRTGGIGSIFLAINVLI